MEIEIEHEFILVTKFKPMQFPHNMYFPANFFMILPKENQNSFIKINSLIAFCIDCFKYHICHVKKTFCHF